MSTKFDVPKFEGRAKDCEVVRAGEAQRAEKAKLESLKRTAARLGFQLRKLPVPKA